MKVELVQIPVEITDVSLKQYLADCSSVVRNAQPKDNERLFQRLLKESYGGKASRVFEFIPCTLGMGDFMLGVNQLDQHFGFFSSEDEAYYTNARELLNAGTSWNDVKRVVDFTHYRAVKIKAPYFVYGQLSTHNQITTVSHSARYTESTLGYWVPDEIITHFVDRDTTMDEIQTKWNWVVENYNPKQLQEYMKLKGITRREVFARGSDMLQYRVATLGGYTNNPNAWQHFINQRLHDAHTQRETRQVAQMISDVIYDL